MLPQPSVRNLQFLICACTKARTVSLGPSTFGRFCNAGIQAHRLLGSSLLAMLGEVGNIRYALKVFHALPADDKSRWDHLINAYLKNGKQRSGLFVYQKMHQVCAFPPRARTLVAILKACINLKDLKTGQLVHHQINQFQNADVYIGGALVDLYANCGCLTKAREVFDTLPVLDAVVWNILIRGYVGRNKCKEAFNVFKEMQAKGLCPNAVTYVLILKSFSHGDAKERSMILHCLVATQSLVCNSHVFSAIINVLVDCGSLEDAKELFEAFPKKDVAVWNALMAGYCKHERNEEAVHLFSQMHHEGVSPNNITYVLVLNACATLGATDTTCKLCREIESRGLHKTNVYIGSGLAHTYAKFGFLPKALDLIDIIPVRSVITWNALIAGYVNGKHNEEAFDCFERMKLEGLFPSAVTYACILRACGATGSVDKGIEIHEELTRQGVYQENVFLGSSLVAMYANCGALTQAQDVFDMLSVRNVVTWGALLSGYAHFGRVESVLLMVSRMVNDGHEPDQVAFACVLTACSHAGLVDTGNTYYEAISGIAGIPPFFLRDTCIIDLFGRAGQIQNAITVMNNMPFHPDLVTFISLLGSC